MTGPQSTESNSVLSRNTIAGAVARAIEHFPDSDFEHLFATMHIAASGALNDDERFGAVLRATQMRARDDRIMLVGRGA